MIKRRDFIRTSVTSIAAASAVTSYAMPSINKGSSSYLDNLKPMTDDVIPISLEERKARIAKAQKLMIENKMDAIYLDGGTSMKYFTGVDWGNSERMMAAIIPAKGEVKYVGPHFEETRLRELIKIGTDVCVWEEHE